MNTRTESVFFQPPVPVVPGGRPASLRRIVWAEQEQCGHEPCFGTQRRLFCEESGCPWRGECLSLRAAWRR
ncbi:MAG: hypothetical protein ACM3ZT_11130 [Bacillota bacterium]